MSQEQKEKKPWYKKWWLWVIIAVVVVCAIAGGNSSEERSNQNTTSTIESSSSESAMNEEVTSDPELDGINFSISKVRNDATGNWRVSTINEPIIMSDHAVAYYEKYISDDSEIHAIVNFNKGTTTKIMETPLGICATTYEYVDGEEHDAKKLFSGLLLTEQYFDPETGEEIQID